MDDAKRIAAGLSDAQRRAVSSAVLMITGRYRMPYSITKDTWEALWREGLADHGSSYLNDAGLAVRAILERQTNGK